MKNTAFFITLLLNFCGKIILGQNTNFVDLNIDIISQKTSTWCWAASIEMALKHYSIQSSQCEIVTKYKNTKNCDCSNDILNINNCSLGEDYKLKLFRCVENLWPESEADIYKSENEKKNLLNQKRDSTIMGIFKSYNKNFNLEVLKAGFGNNVLDFDSVVTNLKNNKVILAYCNDSRHMVIVRGAYQDVLGNYYFVINDPFQKVSYKNFVKKIRKKDGLCKSYSYSVNLKNGNTTNLDPNITLKSTPNYCFDRYIIVGKS